MRQNQNIFVYQIEFHAVLCLFTNFQSRILGIFVVGQQILELDLRNKKRWFTHGDFPIQNER